MNIITSIGHLEKIIKSDYFVKAYAIWDELGSHEYSQARIICQLLAITFSI